MSYLHQVVVWAIKFFVQFNDQAFKEGWKLSFLFPRLRRVRERERSRGKGRENTKYVHAIDWYCIVWSWPHWLDFFLEAAPTVIAPLCVCAMPCLSLPCSPTQLITRAEESKENVALFMWQEHIKLANTCLDVYGLISQTGLKFQFPSLWKVWEHGTA